MFEQLPNVAVILGLAILSTLIMAYKTMKKFRFWFFDIWADLPIIGTIARWSRMKSPSSDVANARLDKLFHAYWLHIPTPINEERFDQLRTYLFLARDEQSKPTPAYAWLLLLPLICAESYAFSLLLGVALAANDMSQGQANMIAAGVSFILGVVFLVLAHASGHTLRRANELRRARPHAIDISAPMPKDEKPKKDLVGPISIDDDQDKDNALLANYDSQRFLNRAANGEGDKGNFFLPVAFITGLFIIAFLQFELRTTMSAVAESAGMSSLSSADATNWANSLFVIIFLMTQGMAILFGYKFGFLGQGSDRAYKIIEGRNDYSDYNNEREPMVRKADESLASLHAKLKSKYSNVQIHDLNFRQRVDLEDGTSSPPPQHRPVESNAQASMDNDNVTPLTRDANGSEK